MAPSVLWRRSATAVGLYLSVALGILGTIVAAPAARPRGRSAASRPLWRSSDSRRPSSTSPSRSPSTKFGFRYIAAEEWGSCAASSAARSQLKLVGGALATLLLLAFAPFADTVFGADGLTGPMLAAAVLAARRSRPRTCAPARSCCGAATTSAAAALRDDGAPLVAIPVGAQFGVSQALVAIVAGAARRDRGRGHGGLARVPPLPDGPSTRRSASERREIVSFVAQSSIATGVLSLRAALAPLLLGVVAGTTQVGLPAGRAGAAERLRRRERPGTAGAAHRADARLGARPRALGARAGAPLLAAAAGVADRRRPDLLRRSCRGSSASSSAASTSPARRRGAHHARRGGDPARARLVEVAAGHDRPAAAADL